MHVVSHLPECDRKIDPKLSQNHRPAPQHVSFIRFNQNFIFLNFVHNLFQVCVYFANLCRRLIHIKKFSYYLSLFSEICLEVLLFAMVYILKISKNHKNHHVEIMHPLPFLCALHSTLLYWSLMNLGVEGTLNSF